MCALEAHHALTCKRGNDVIARHNHLRGTCINSSRKPCTTLSWKLAVALVMTRNDLDLLKSYSQQLGNGKPAAFYLSVSSLLKPDIVSEAGHTAGSAAFATEQCKLQENLGIYEELGWSCIPLVVESFGAWGQLASNIFSKLVSRLSVQANSTISTTLDSIYSRLNFSLVRSNARAFLARADPGTNVSELYLVC